MCGIFGEFLFDKPIDISISFKKMNLMTHRGPDGFGFEFGNFNNGRHNVFHNIDSGHEDVRKGNKNTNYFLGHRRLSINDLSVLAFQPMESFDQRYSITFNGEIYNFIELKKELLDVGSRFKTDHSDTEILLNAYAVWGIRCLEKFNGMFAFAIFDRQENTIFLARDRIGEKPLYYEFTQERFIFASELSAIVKLEEERRKINLDALAGYLTFGYVLHPLSIFDGIRKLPPASYAFVDLKKRDILISKYWDISFNENRLKSADDFVENVEEGLNRSVALRLRADVPIGAFISGGTDSTLVIKKIKELQGEIEVFGADFPGTSHSEIKYIKEASARYGHGLNIISMDLSKKANIKDIISVFDEPFDGGSAIAVFELFKEARKKYKVILTGDGGDELFAGYTRYREFYKKNDLVKKIPGIVKLKGILKLFVSMGIASSKINRLLEFISADRITNYLYDRYNFSLTQLLRSNSRDYNFEQIDDISSITKSNDVPLIKALQYLEFKTILPGRMLYKIDRFSMYYGVEARPPIIDHTLAEIAFSIPYKFNVDDKHTKIILKRILQKDFNESFVNRKKQGFGNPLDLWFRSSKVEDLFGRLLNKSSLIYRYLDYEKLHKAFPQIRNGYNGENANEIWRLIVLEQYLENFKEFIKDESIAKVYV